MPDFEIRYFHADGSLAVVHVTTYDFQSQAEEYARRHQGGHAHFAVQEIKVAPPKR
jgi:hypothetical protein